MSVDVFGFYHHMASNTCDTCGHDFAGVHACIAPLPRAVLNAADAIRDRIIGDGEYDDANDDERALVDAVDAWREIRGEW